MKYQELILASEDVLKAASTGQATNGVLVDVEQNKVESAALGVAGLLGDVAEALGKKAPKWSAFFGAAGITKDIAGAKREFDKNGHISQATMAKLAGHVASIIASTAPRTAILSVAIGGSVAVALVVETAEALVVETAAGMVATEAVPMATPAVVMRPVRLIRWRLIWMVTAWSGRTWQGPMRALIWTGRASASPRLG